MTDLQRELLNLVFWIIGSTLASLVAGVILRRLLIPLSKKTPGTFDTALFEAIDGRAQWVVLAMGLHLGASLAFTGAAMQTYRAHQLWRVCTGVLYINLVLAITMAIYALTKGAVDWYAENFAERTQTRFDDQAVRLFNRFAKLVFLFIALTIMFKHFNVEITGLLATAGIASLAFAFAAQDTLANMISGVILMFDRPFKRGDRITLPSGDLGDVIEIGLRSTKVLSFDQTVIVIPNAALAKSTIVNHNAPDSKIKIRHSLGVAYGSDMHKVKSIIMDILRAHPDILDDPEQEVFFTGFGDSSLDLAIRFWITDYRQRLRVLDEVNMAIKDRFEAENVEIPFPQRDVYIRSQAAPSSSA